MINIAGWIDISVKKILHDSNELWFAHQFQIKFSMTYSSNCKKFYSKLKTIMHNNFDKTYKRSIFQKYKNLHIVKSFFPAFTDLLSWNARFVMSDYGKYFMLWLRKFAKFLEMTSEISEWSSDWLIPQYSWSVSDLYFLVLSFFCNKWYEC